MRLSSVQGTRPGFQGLPPSHGAQASFPSATRFGSADSFHGDDSALDDVERDLRICLLLFSMFSIEKSSFSENQRPKKSPYLGDLDEVKELALSKLRTLLLL